MRVPKTMNTKKPSFLGFFYSLVFVLLPFFSSCTPFIAEHCLSSSEMQITATIPENAINMETGDIVESGTIQTFGVFLQKNMLLTVAHANPPATILSDFSVRKRDDKNELLLLNTAVCGKKISLAKKNAKKNEDVFWCENREKIGNINEENTETIADFSPFGKAKTLQNLQKIYGNFYKGESGKGVCNASGEVVGILVSVDTHGAFLIPVKKIIDFAQ